MQNNIVKPLENLISICNQYKNGEIDTVAFQGTIANIFLPHETSAELSREQDNLHEHLEIIIFTEYGEDHIKCAEPYVDDLITATKAEITRLANYTPYATASQLQAT
ncbi:MAG: hypothetical protein FWG65_07840 [Turicibacter sp.]|nr:hypothetical protein [Turicibacter sp.]